MTDTPNSLLGGASVFCINERQMAEAQRLANEDAQSAPRIQSELARLEASLSRNECAALAFVLIERLRESA